MAHLTTDTSRYFDSIKSELTSISNERLSDWLFTYCQIGQKLDHGFSISFFDNQNAIQLKSWNAEFDNSKYYLKIFNLDSLTIIENTIGLNKVEFNDIVELYKPEEFFVMKPKAIILDGVYCELSSKTKSLIWNINEEMNLPLSSFIQVLEQKACL